jgi:hypothetical protein
MLWSGIFLGNYLFLTIDSGIKIRMPSGKCTSIHTTLFKSQKHVAQILSSIAFSGLSINQFLNKKEDGKSEEEYKVATGEARSDFHQEQLNPLWLEYAKTIEARGKVSLFRLFSDQLPKIDNNYLLHFPVESQALAGNPSNKNSN